MYIPTNKFSEIKWNLLWQPAVCMLYMAAVLFFMGVKSGNTAIWAAGASSLASRAYCVFVVPKGIVSHPLRIILGYLIACLIGMLLHLGLTAVYHNINLHDVTNTHFFWVSAALSVGLSMIVMVFAGAQHPPAAGMSLVMVMDVNDARMFGVIWISIILLVLLRCLLRNKLKNLLE